MLKEINLRAMHTKGVLILSGFRDKNMPGYSFINSKYMFEQMYSGVDGDSASSAEPYAILSFYQKFR